MRYFVVIATLLFSADQARADMREWQLTLTPTIEVLHREERTGVGAGGVLRGAYGLIDNLAVEVSLGCAHVPALEARGVEAQGLSGRVVYDATRCTFGPMLAGRFGERFVTTLGAGVAYRIENASARDLVAPNGFKLFTLEPETSHALVAEGRAAFEWRPVDWFAFGPTLTARLAMVGGPVELDLGAGLVLALLFYP